MTDALGLADKVNKFNRQAMRHMEGQTLNPFSDRFSRSPSPRPRFNKDEYGKPVAGSLTELRGQRAHSHINREILELCTLIHDVVMRQRTMRGEPDPESEPENADDQIIISFGELFAIYTKISDKVVGLLIAAKKRGYVYFEPEILFQRRDDDVLIALMMPIQEIRAKINKQLADAKAAAASAPSSDKGEQTLA